jgi:AraC-like DNA-binding protein
MEKALCKIQCKGVFVPDRNWINITKFGINRLYYIEEGIGYYTENGVNIPFETGKIYFIPFYASVPTYTYENAKLKHVYVNFTLTPPIVSKKVFCLDPNTSDKIKTAVAALRSFCSDSIYYAKLKDPITELQIREREFLKSITVFLTESAVAGRTDDILSDKTIINALDIIHSTLHEKLTINDIAARCFMSTDGFIKKFSRAVGETPYAYMKKLKITMANIMRAEGATAEEAAQAYGYADASSLIHAISSVQK